VNRHGNATTSDPDGGDTTRDDGRSQERAYDRWRRRRKQRFHDLYRAFDETYQKVCWYCARHKATTFDHCPSLLLLDALGADYFRERSIPLLLIPACITCNNDMGTSHVYHDGRFVHLDWRRVLRYRRLLLSKSEPVRSVRPDSVSKNRGKQNPARHERKLPLGSHRIADAKSVKRAARHALRRAPLRARTAGLADGHAFAI
jgi:hypothetical protein